MWYKVWVQILLILIFNFVHWGILFACMYYIPRKRIPGFSLLFLFCFLMARAASWGCQYSENELRARSRLFFCLSASVICMSDLGPMTSCLSYLPLRFTIMFPALRSSAISNLPVYRCSIISKRLNGDFAVWPSKNRASASLFASLML